MAEFDSEAPRCLLERKPFDFFEAHVLDPRRLVPIDPKPELAQPNHRPRCHQHAALDGVVELADVAGPWMIEQRLQRSRLEACDVLAIALRMLPQEMMRERRNVLAPAPERWQ